MAFEAAREALDGVDTPPTAVVGVCLSAPFGLRKLSATLARALDLPDSTVPFDLGGHPGGLLDAFALAEALSTEGSVLVVVADHQVSHEQRVCDTLSAGGASAFLIGASGGFATLGPQARASSEVYDVWKLGTEAEARYRLEVLFDAYAKAAEGAIGALAARTEVPTASYGAVCASQPHPQTLRALAKAGVSEEQLSATSFVGEIGNLGAASVGLALTLGFDAASADDRVLAFGYGAGEGIAQPFTLNGPPPVIGASGRIAGEPIALGTYYRWTRGRQVEPH